jgi:proteasome lid subunit RPN8/RPN11
MICDLARADLNGVIREAAIASYPKEACGVVLSVGKKSLPVVCGNTSPAPENHFIIDLHDYAAACDRGEIIGIWHTHVESPAKPSDADRAGCENSDLPWYIVSIYKVNGHFQLSEVEVLTPSGFEMEYIGRPYVFGVFDCWTLIRDYYRREFNICLGDYPRIEKFWRKGHNFFGENWEKEGFKKLIDVEPKSGDLFLFQTDNNHFPDHIGVYIGDDTFLHHSYGRLSRRDIYGGYWHKHTSFHLRHKTKQ